MKQIKILLLLLSLSLLLPAWAEEEKEKEAAALPTPGYLALESMVVNLSKGAKHVRFEVQLMVDNKDQMGDLRTHLPAIMNEMLMLASEADGAQLKTPKGKEAFRLKAKDACNAVLKELTGIETPLRDL
ncbi:MAG: flagellar basal body-associated FliL family protein, partial [Gammaproteobacteria bacterium]|nr:flagellar basal body-associated FliL family protein [Gammaproteobacteria bacterium]